MSDAYIDTSQTYNGDGTSSAAATSDGGVGAYNSIASFLAVASTSGQTRGILRRLNLGTSISVTAQLSPPNDGGASARLELIGYPLTKSFSGKSVSYVNRQGRTGGAKFHFNIAADSDVGNSADWDFGWCYATATFHQSGSDNDGLTREVTWCKYDATNSEMEFAVFPDLPADLTTSATVDFSYVGSEGYAGSIPSVTAWDSDTNFRPILDAGSGAYHLLDFYYDSDWQVSNLHLKHGAGYYALRYVGWSENIVVEGGKGIYNLGRFSSYGNQKYLYVYTDSYGASWDNAFYYRAEHIHSNTDYASDQPLMIREDVRLKSGSFGKMANAYEPIRLYPNGTYQNYENCDFYDVYSNSGEACRQRFHNCNIDGSWRDFYEQTYTHKTRTITSDDTTYWSAPPSGASFELQCTPTPYCDDEDQPDSVIFDHPVVVEANVAKTITVKIRPHGWSTAITDEQIWLESERLCESSGIKTTLETIKGTGSTSYANDTWSDLTLSFTPEQSGMLMVTVKIKAYYSGAYVLIDPDSGA